VILSNFISLRTQWSGLGTTDPDGLKTWDTSLLELGFTGANITCEKIASGVIYDFTVAAASDWYVSQRADWFTVSQTDSTTLRLSVSAAGLVAISPDGMTQENRKRLFRGLHVYCKRISDNAIGVFNCEARELYTLSTTGQTLTGG
jgi:hypothetical protein